MEKNLLDELKHALQKEQARLRAALGAISKEGKSFEPVFEDMGSDEEASQDEAELYRERWAADRELEDALTKVEHALDKLEREIYGLCEKCGKEIPVERLKAAPEAEHCLEHAQ